MSTKLSPCLLALEFLERGSVQTKCQNLPRGSPSYYIPKAIIKTLLGGSLEGLKLRDIFLCDCFNCVRDGRPQAHREDLFVNHEAELRDRYSIIYATLIYIRRPGLITLFQEKELYLQAPPKYFQDGDFEFLKRAEVHDPDEVKKLVLREQYKFLVRTLEPRDQITDISPLELLPIDESPEPKGRGAFGELWCFTASDQDYLADSFKKICVNRFARKIFVGPSNKEAGESWSKEWFNLLRISRGQRHEHIMSAFGAYMHGNIFFILFEEAEQSLHDYLKGKGPRFDSTELWKQYEGVTCALACLHRLAPNGRLAYHRDLKPANILIVNRVMKISDFGLLEFKPVHSSEASISSGIISNIRHEYEPPPGPRYSQKSDVWSLGAIGSELAVSDIQGVKAVEEYRADRISDISQGSIAVLQGSRTFYLLNSLKKSVRDRHDQLEALFKPLHPSTKGKGKAFSEWQIGFYKPGFFLLLNRMFDLTLTSEEVVNQLKALTTPRFDIWEEQESGRLLKWPYQKNCQFQAYLCLEYSERPPKCVMRLYNNTVNDVKLEYRWDEPSVNGAKRLEHVEPVKRGDKTKFIPTSSSKKNEHRVIIKMDESNLDFRFPTITDLLRFQTGITGQYCFQYKSYHAKSWMLNRTTAVLQSPESSGFDDDIQVQLWSSSPLHTDDRLWTTDDETPPGASQPRKVVPTLYVAIYSPMWLLLVKVKHPFKVPDFSNSAEMKFSNPEVYRISKQDGFPTEWTRNTVKRSKRWDVGSLVFKKQEDCKDFHDDLVLFYDMGKKATPNTWSNSFPF